LNKRRHQPILTVFLGLSGQQNQTFTPTEGSYTNFILANGSHGIGFYTLSQAGEIGAGKAYLQLPTAAISSNGARSLTMLFDDEDKNILITHRTLM